MDLTFGRGGASDTFSSKFDLFFSLLDIVSSVNQDSYVKLVVSSLNYSKDNNTRHVLAKALCSSSEVMYIKLLVYLLPIKSNGNIDFHPVCLPGHDLFGLVHSAILQD